MFFVEMIILKQHKFSLQFQHQVIHSPSFSKSINYREYSSGSWTKETRNIET